MTKLVIASIYETAKSIAVTSYASKIMADTIRKAAVSLSALAYAMRKVARPVKEE